MKKLLAGLALSAALVAGSVAAISTPAEAAGVYLNIGGGHHWHHHHYWHRTYWHRHHWHHHHHWH